MLFLLDSRSLFLYAESFLATCMLVLLDSRSLSLYTVSLLATCMLFLFDSRSLSLYAASLLATCILFLFDSRSPSLYAASFLAACIMFLFDSRSLSLYAASFLATCSLFLFDSCSQSLYTASFLATCMLFLFDSRSLSLNWVFPRNLHADSVWLTLTIPVCWIFPRRLLVLSVTFSMYNASSLATFIHFVLRSRSSSLKAASSHAIFLLVLLCCFSYSLNSDCVLARLFHSVLYCHLLSLDWSKLLSYISMAAFCMLSFAPSFVSECFLLNQWAKSFWDSRYLSTISCAERTLPVAESTTGLFLPNTSPLLHSPDVLSQLFVPLLASADMPVPILTWLCPVDCAILSLRLPTLSYICFCLSLFYHFRHDLSIHRLLLIILILLSVHHISWGTLICGSSSSNILFVCGAPDRMFQLTATSVNDRSSRESNVICGRVQLTRTTSFIQNS